MMSSISPEPVLYGLVQPGNIYFLIHLLYLYIYSCYLSHLHLVMSRSVSEIVQLFFLAISISNCDHIPSKKLVIKILLLCFAALEELSWIILVIFIVCLVSIGFFVPTSNLYFFNSFCI